MWARGKGPHYEREHDHHNPSVRCRQATRCSVRLPQPHNQTTTLYSHDCYVLRPPLSKSPSNTIEYNDKSPKNHHTPTRTIIPYSTHAHRPITTRIHLATSLLHHQHDSTVPLSTYYSLLTIYCTELRIFSPHQLTSLGLHSYCVDCVHSTVPSSRLNASVSEDRVAPVRR